MGGGSGKGSFFHGQVGGTGSCETAYAEQSGPGGA
jgi:hypothetical protein